MSNRCYSDFNYSRKNKIITFGSNVEIGDRVHIASVEGVEIGDRCLIASNIYISDHDHGKTNISEMRNVPKNRALNSKKVFIGSDCWIGQNVCILKGCKIGKNSVIISCHQVISRLLSNSRQSCKNDKKKNFSSRKIN